MLSVRSLTPHRFMSFPTRRQLNRSWRQLGVAEIASVIGARTLFQDMWAHWATTVRKDKFQTCRLLVSNVHTGLVKRGSRSNETIDL
ncbi:Dvir\GJ10278-PA-like protein [Anopheles sinensis]|uniref:Dvir\GJ10278-PA-like protein n=1 Tax=Anopheles sinensis TaxID=74873 RepID=A0A084VBM9_ANOSI|nr:Dvir\GJ10278-PA-like protein [Anopheles sinensis]